MTSQEKRVRELRDAIYGRASDEAWEAVKDNWMTPENVDWLRSQPQNRN